MKMPTTHTTLVVGGEYWTRFGINDRFGVHFATRANDEMYPSFTDVDTGAVFSVALDHVVGRVDEDSDGQD